MLYILKFDYSSIDAPGTQTKLLTYSSLSDANWVFGQLEHSYQFCSFVRVNGNKEIKVFGVWLFSTLTENYDEAKSAAISGSGRLFRKAHSLEIELEN